MCRFSMHLRFLTVSAGSRRSGRPASSDVCGKSYLKVKVNTGCLAEIDDDVVISLLTHGRIGDSLDRN